jgi:hypothetical protein
MWAWAPELRRELTCVLSVRLPDPSPARRRLRQLIDHARVGYLDRWAVEVDGANQPKPERLARIIATHLLDLGYSPLYLIGWVGQQRRENADMADVLRSAAELDRTAERKYEVLLALHKIPQRPQLAEPLDNWLSGAAVTAWLRDHGYSTNQVRAGGGFVYHFSARDPYGAAAQARSMAERLVARSAFLRRDRGGVEPLPCVWVAGHSKAIQLAPAARGADVLSLVHEGHMYKVDGARSKVDDALELAAPINKGPLGPALAGGWAAVESLLTNPDDPREESSGKAVAADRLAAIITCSWPRAELTTLANRYQRSCQGELADRLGACATSRERSRVMANALTGETEFSFGGAQDSSSEMAALDRMRKLLIRPKPTLQDVLAPIKVAMRRFYRARNIVLHGGSTQGAALEAALRTGAPLLGAGLDRITHAALVEGLDPLDLAARAETALGLVGGETSLSVVDLLERPIAPRASW